jgi:Protein of unknown function (DUF3137)
LVRLLLLLAGFAVAGVAAWWRARGRVDREHRLLRLCQRAGLDFAPIDPFPDTTWVVHPRFAHPEQRALNVVWNRDADDGVRVFDLWYVERLADDGGHDVPRSATCAVVPVGCACARLTVVPRGTEDAGAGSGDEAVEMELDEFNRRFRVRSDDRRFAFAFLDQRMMQTLLGLPEGVLLDAFDETVVLWAPRLEPERVLLLFEAARAVGEHVPHVVADLYPPHSDGSPYEKRWLQGHWSPEPAGPS